MSNDILMLAGRMKCQSLTDVSRNGARPLGVEAKIFGQLKSLTARFCVCRMLLSVFRMIETPRVPGYRPLFNGPSYVSSHLSVP